MVFEKELAASTTPFTDIAHFVVVPRTFLVHPTQEYDGLRPRIFQGISPVSNGTCLWFTSADILDPPGETESGSAGTQPDKGYPGSGAPMARQAPGGLCHQGPFS